ncbi:tRNA (adenosine(37)-N6)-dimethylallyltransferase MiaA [Desulfosediminicola sp.]|uniref:tRNA (adenosine(37)-N6)-dimethylallyltransferase MiaA n=1 Tax=Desulfosediminicola sp. TaxID=2886825 RepID=UPI003AF2D7FF
MMTESTDTIYQELTNTPVLALVGPTAIGKTDLSLEIARVCNCEIISVDSMQVYKFMDIGTAKIKPEEMAGIPHHLIDVAYPDEEYDAARFVKEAAAAIAAIIAKGKTPLLTGGTGLYLKALVDGLFAGVPEDREIREQLKLRAANEGTSKLHEELSLCDRISADRIHPNDTLRIIRGLEIYLASGVPWSEHLRRQKQSEQNGIVNNILQVGLTCDRQKLYERINMRSEIMLEQGLEEEVMGLLKMGYHENLNSMKSIGYRHMLNFLSGLWNYEEMMEYLARDTRRYAKRQYTWFNKITDLEWFEVENKKIIIDHMSNWLQKQH